MTPARGADSAMSLIFSTKARTLAGLQGRLASAQVLPQVCATVAEWRGVPAGVIARIEAAFGDQTLIVRSSALGEDAATQSLAGLYDSVSGVRPQGLAQAIDIVIASYGAAVSDGDEVLVQPQLNGVSCSGVVFSVDPNAGAPDCIVNFHEGDDTAAVTAGRDAEQRTWVHVRGAAHVARPELAGVLALVEELSALSADVPLDIEFAIAGGVLYLLQVRPLVLRVERRDPQHHLADLRGIEARLERGFAVHPFLHGRTTVYGVMPDWNPAEIVGLRPRPLSLSLYRDLVTDAIWAYQRHNYGYKNLRSHPLLVDLHGLPYIDVRVSFNSFVPRDIEGELADRLVDWYITHLLDAPALHDKVEFEIVFSCYTLDLPQRLAVLHAQGFSDAETGQLATSLRALTNRIINPDTGLWRTDREKLAVLVERRQSVLDSALDPVAKMYWLLEDCKRYGTLPFAGLARAGFIAAQILRSLVHVGVFSQDDYDGFMGSLNTVSSQLGQDKAQLGRAAFLDRYGHLRPGTYDILSPRYDEAPDSYFAWDRPATGSARHRTAFALPVAQMREVSHLLRQHGIEGDVLGFFDFLQAAIELREHSKFLFTRNLSDVIALLASWGSGLGFTRDDLSYADVRTIQSLYSTSRDPREALAASIEAGRTAYARSCGLTLPPLISAPEQVWSFELPSSEPNFVTQKSVTAPLCSHADKDALAGCIVTIPSADPGFDWLFSHPIAGLVTAYGGANSHMAVRAAELGLPAVIGAGQTLYDRWSSARMLAIDCAARKVDVIA